MLTLILLALLVLAYFYLSSGGKEIRFGSSNAERHLSEEERKEWKARKR